MKLTHSQEVHARFFPAAKPIVKADPDQWRRWLPRKRFVNRRPKVKDPSEVAPPPLPIERVLMVACSMFDLTKAELLGHGREAMMIAARIYIAVRLKKEYGYSMSGIGRVLNRDHSSIHNLLAKVAGVPFGPRGKRRGGA